jgi:hypothetical protein
MWRGWVRTELATAYVGYITGMGLREYVATAGNLGAEMWARDVGELALKSLRELVGVANRNRGSRRVGHRPSWPLPRG